MKTMRITDSRRSIVEEDESEVKMEDKEEDINMTNKLKNITINSHGVLEDIRPGIDRITFSFKDYFNAFEEIQDRLEHAFTFTRCFKTERGSFIYKYTRGLSLILLEKRSRHDYTHRKPWHIWHTLTITNPTSALQLAIKEILIDVANNDNRKHIPHQISLSQVEFSLDFYTTKETYLKPLSVLMGHHPVLRHTRGIRRTFYNYKGTTYQGKEHNVRKGSKGTRKYLKNEHDRDFVRLELQCNHSFLVNHSLTLNDLPLKNDEVDVLDHIDLRYGLNDTTLDKLCKALSNKHYKCTRSVEFSDQIPKERFYHIFKKLLELNACHDYLGLNYTPVPEQIHYFKEQKRNTGITHQTDQFFPKMNWSDFFKLVINKSTDKPQLEGMATSSSNINSTTFIDPEPEWLTINDHEEYLNELEAESKDDTEYELLDSDSDRHAKDIIDEFDDKEDQLGVISSEADDFEHTNSTLEKNQNNLCTQSTYMPEPIILPSRKWMDATLKLARFASEAIYYEYCPWVKDILAEYGIDESHYSRHLLGYNSNAYTLKCSDLELERDNCGTIYIPDGLIIPHMIDFDMLKLVIFKRDGLNKYSRYVVPGGYNDHCFAIDNHMMTKRTIVVVDELDAIYINQSLGLQYNVIALGHPEAKPDSYSMDILNNSKYIIMALGNKQGGNTATLWWEETFGEKVRDLPLLAEKNFCQTFRSEEDLSSWALTIFTRKNPRDFINRPIPQPWW